MLERLRIGEIADADAAPGDLVLVGGPDAARGRPDLPLAPAGLGQQIEVAVIRQDEVRLVADDDPIGDVDPALRQLIDFGEERPRVDDDAVADHADDAWMEDAGRYQPQDELRPAEVDGVAGVVTALIPRDDVEMWREQIDDLALAFVAPLGAQDREVHNVVRFYMMRVRSRVPTLDGNRPPSADIDAIAGLIETGEIESARRSLVK